MIKPRLSRVVFSAGIAPSESEYFDEINAYKKKTWWIVLLCLTRTMITVAGGVQMTYYAIMNDIRGICYVPELSQNNWTYDELSLITTAYGYDLHQYLERCKYFDYDYKTFANVSFQEALNIKKKLGLQKIKSCIGGNILLSPQSSKYHTANSTFCYAKKLASTVVQVGSAPEIFSSIFFGILGDLFGRRKIALIATIMWTFCGILLAFIPFTGLYKVFLYATSRFFLNAISLLTYVNLLEICHKKIRFFTVLTLYGSVIGFLICTRYGDHLNFNWKYLQYISLSFNVFALFHCYYVPESPRWLINKSKYKQALKVMKEIIGYVPNEILFEDEGSEAPFSCKIFRNMMAYMFKKKLKTVIILTSISAIIGFIYNIQIWRMITSKLPLRATILAAASNLLSLPFTLIVYAALGKKFGLFWTFLLTTFISFLTLCLHDTIPMEQYANAILILNCSTAEKFLYAYLPDMLPTFLRCTGLGIALSLFSVMETITVAFVNWELTAQNYVYVIFLMFSVPGFFIFKLPDTTNSDLPTARLFHF